MALDEFILILKIKRLDHVLKNNSFAWLLSSDNKLFLHE